MKRILSILVLASILICSLAACGGESSDSDYSANTEPETIDSEQEAIAKVKSYYQGYRTPIGLELGFTRFGQVTYFYQDVDVDYLKEGDYNYEHGQVEYTVCVRGEMEGQDDYGNYDIKKFQLLAWVYPDGYVQKVQVTEID